MTTRPPKATTITGTWSAQAAASVFQCREHRGTFTGMGLQSVICCGKPAERVA